MPNQALETATGILTRKDAARVQAAVASSRATSNPCQPSPNPSPPILQIEPEMRSDQPASSRPSLPSAKRNSPDPCQADGTNRRVERFPYGLQETIRGTTGELMGIPLPPTQVRQAEEAAQFQRPREHEERIEITIASAQGFVNAEGEPIVDTGMAAEPVN